MFMFNLGKHPPSLLSLSEKQERLLSIWLNICNRCGHVFNIDFEEGELDYSGSSCRMYNDGVNWQEHVDSVRDKVNALKADVVVEIGAGDCSFLKSLKAPEKIAIDPCDPPSELDGIRFVESEFSDTLVLPQEGKMVIVIRHLLEHVSEPRDFLESIVKLARNRKGLTALLIETPCCQKALSKCRIEDWTYEHPQHFTLNSMRWLLRNVGMEKLQVEASYEGEVLVAVTMIQPEKEDDFPQRVREWYSAVRDNIDEVGQVFRDNVDKIVFWGGAGKSVMFIRLFDLHKDSVVVDSHEDKWHMNVPGTSIPILPPFDPNWDKRKIVVATTSWRANDIKAEIKRLELPVETLYKFENGQLTEVPLDENA
jgi:hypothetical protein